MGYQNLTLIWSSGNNARGPGLPALLGLDDVTALLRDDSTLRLSVHFKGGMSPEQADRIKRAVEEITNAGDAELTLTDYNPS